MAIGRMLRDFIRGPLERIDGENREFLNSSESRGPDWEVIAAFVTVAVMLTLQYYFVTGYHTRWLDQLLYGILPGKAEERAREWLQAGENSELSRLARWTLGNFSVYVIGPVLVITCLLRKRLSDYGAGLNWSVLRDGWPIYLTMFVFMVPFIYFASTRESFRNYYPFYELREGESLWPRFIIWEVLYAGQFIALEFFFRGFLLHAMRKRFGIYAIFVSTVPYCMIHFGKPMPETFGAICAGIALGFMSLKTRSIWLGAALHISVAWTMDTLAVWPRIFG